MEQQFVAIIAGGLSHKALRSTVKSVHRAAFAVAAQEDSGFKVGQYKIEKDSTEVRFPVDASNDSGISNFVASIPVEAKSNVRVIDFYGDNYNVPLNAR